MHGKGFYVIRKAPRHNRSPRIEIPRVKIQTLSSFIFSTSLERQYLCLSIFGKFGILLEWKKAINGNIAQKWRRCFYYPIFSVNRESAFRKERMMSKERGYFYLLFGTFNFEAAKANESLPQLHLNLYSWSKCEPFVGINAHTKHVLNFKEAKNECKDFVWHSRANVKTNISSALFYFYSRSLKRNLTVNLFKTYATGSVAFYIIYGYNKITQTLTRQVGSRIHAKCFTVSGVKLNSTLNPLLCFSTNPTFKSAIDGFDGRSEPLADDRVNRVHPVPQRNLKRHNRIGGHDFRIFQ
ncbi:hypothetical protein V6N13_064432 [Hibiscus sabdariffa]|uniref:C-type lectin domain-containing protein n=1 Tax=Hibiscus sabdariffa TaxID=183260 RepID=A0ABR2EA30_9ROSI